MAYFDIRDISPTEFVKNYRKLGLKTATHKDTGVCHLKRGITTLCGRILPNTLSKYYYHSTCYTCMSSALSQIKNSYTFPDKPYICQRCGSEVFGDTAGLVTLDVEDKITVNYLCGYCCNEWKVNYKVTKIGKKHD